MNIIMDVDRFPNTWVWLQLREVAEVNPRKVSLQYVADKQVNFVPMAAVREEFGGIDVSMMRPYSEVQKGYTQFQEGDILAAKITPCMENGKVAVVPPLAGKCGYGSTEFHVVRPGEAVEGRWVAHFLAQESFRREARMNMSGSAGQLRVPTEWLANEWMPVPPINEQHRIVAKIEELFSDLDAGVAALERAKANLKRYRAAVLKSAVEGKLTAAWRAEHPAAEPASALLERILEERRARWEAEQLAGYEAKGKTPPKNWREKYKEPAAPDTENLPELPEGWCWATIDMLGDVVGGITKGQKRREGDVLREVPYLRVANVQRGYLDLSEVKTIEATIEECNDLRLLPGDVLFNEGGDRDKLGRGWVWGGEVQDCIHQNHVFRLRLFRGELQPKLVSYHGNTFGKQWFLQAGKQSVNLASINMTVLRRFPVPVAPAAEQVEIVQELEDRLSVIDRVGESITNELTHASHLRQSILKRAFEGKLVPQDPSDEPASVLLDLRVWIDAPRELRRRRGIDRDGDSYAPHWSRWEAQELALFAADRTSDRADVVLDGSRPIR